VLDVPARPADIEHRDTFLGTGPQARPALPASLGPSRRTTLLGNGGPAPRPHDLQAPGRVRTLLGSGTAAPAWDPLDEDSTEQVSGVRAVEQRAADARAAEDARTTRPDSVSAWRNLAIAHDGADASPWTQPRVDDDDYDDDHDDHDDEPSRLPLAERPTLTRLPAPRLRMASQVEALFALTVALVVLATMAALFV
jgi:hypothetical protein